jgi:hypothetical protein
VIRAAKNYFNELALTIGAWWNRFWFTPTPATTLGVVRIGTGLMALYALATYGPDLERWFGADGMLPLAMVRELYIGQWSVFDYLPPNMLWPAYWASLAVLVLFTLGVGGRPVAVLSALAAISFFARGPLLTGEFEAILSFLLVYLCVGRSCDALSLTAAWRAKSRQLPASSHPESTRHPGSPTNTIAVRLIQIHLAIVHLMMGWAQLAAPEGPWWSGEGIWLAGMRPGMSLVDLSGLADHPRIVAAWSHVISLYLLAFPAVAWSRLARPLVLAVGVLVWSSIAMASGWLMFCLAMLTGLAAFVDFDRLARRQPH